MQLSRNFRHRSAPRAPIEAVFLDAREQFRSLQSASHVCVAPLWDAFFSRKAHRPFSRNCSEPQLRSSSSHSVPSMQFQVLLTCLSAFFSTFLRSTFPLSVFMSYLDLGEIYLLLYAEITINVTLKEAEIREPIVRYRQGSFTLCAAAFQLTFGSFSPTLPLPRKEHRSDVCIVAKPFSFDLYLLRSPLLEVSCLFSFPPLNNMLKFSG